MSVSTLGRSGRPAVSTGKFQTCLLTFAFSLLLIFPSAALATNTVLEFTQTVPDSLCPDEDLYLCAELSEACGGGSYAPLPNRWIYFFINDNGCGVDVGQTPEDSVQTDSNGVACVLLTAPSVPGTYGMRVKFQGEDKPGPGDPPNGACNPNQRVQLSNSNACEDVVVDSAACNRPPEVTCAGDMVVTQCTLQQVCLTGFSCWDPDGDLDTCFVSTGTLSGDTVCFTPAAPGSYEIVYTAVDSQLNVASCTTTVTVQLNSDPMVSLPADTSVFICDPTEFCFSVDISDADCDITSVVSSPDQYAGTVAGFDQVARLNGLGGSVTQIGGGAPGKVLYTASDFVPPINSQSGVSVALPNFSFAGYVVQYGSFPSGLTAANSADHLLGSPTDMTFTAAGIGGPDGGDGDGSVAFAVGNWCSLGFNSAATTCNGSNSDLFLFTNTGSTGTAQLDFTYNGAIVYTMTQSIPGGTAGSGSGGVTVDVPDGITFDALRLQALSGTFEIDAVAVRTAASSSLTDICFTADTTGLYPVIVTATDACGNTGGDTMYVTVTRNSAPTANAGADFSVFQCAAEEICFGVSFSDPDNNLALTELVSGPGTLSGGQVCFTPATAGTYSFIIHAVDSCGLEDYDTVAVTVTRNSPPVAVDPDTFTVFLCQSEPLCYTFTATDPDGGPLTWTHIAGAGGITPGGEFCLTPTFSGLYGAVVAVSDSCGAADTVTINYVVTINSAPVAVDPGPVVDLLQCTVEQVCYTFGATDVNNGPLTWTKLSGDGTLTGSQWCFTPGGSGTYTITAQVADSCGAADTVSHTYNVTVNDPPSIAFGNDTSLFLCDPQEICLGYTVSDPQGPAGLVETMISGYGTLDTSANQVCFTPTEAGVYEFIVQVSDTCNETDIDTVIAIVDFGLEAAIACPAGPIEVSLCNPDTVCQILTITPASATVTTSYGTYSNGQLCFVADTSGTYLIDVIAEESCGSDTCQLTFNVDIGAAASITCPDPLTLFLCEADSVCVPVNINGTDLNVTVSPIGAYSAGNVCFPADTSGHYEISVVADTPCGSDSCVIVADITINTPPVATDPATPVDTFLCAADQICYQFAASDVNGGTLTWLRLSGNGTVSATGQWCFSAATAGTYTVTAAVTDSCGARDTVALTYNVTINTDPVLSLGNDTTLFQCLAGIVCWNYSLVDPDDNVTLVEILSGDPSGYINDAAGQLCFDPAGTGVYEFIVRATDACGAADIDTIVFTINVNSAPTVDLGPDQTVFQCSAAELCLPVTATDPDGNLTAVDLIEGPGTFDSSQICFTPAGDGDYQFVVRVTDYCGVEAYDTVVVHYTLNSPPTADAGADQTLFLCESVEICWPASCSDPDGNLTGCTLVEGPGTYDGSQICFTPTADGTYLFVLEAVDACGEVDRDSVTVEVTINTGPTCVVPNDTAISLCTSQEICLPAYATDPDGNLESCQILSGPGSLSGGNWCYTPVSDQSVTVQMQCEDSCGAVCTSQFTIDFDINSAPQIVFGPDIDTFLCDVATICLPYTASDADGLGTTTISLVSGPGTLNAGTSEVCFDAAAAGTYTFIVEIVDGCGAIDRDTINVDVSINSAPVASAGADQDLFLCEPGTEICWPASCSDVDGNLVTCNLVGPGTYDGSSICFAPSTSGEYEFILEATDDCGITAVDTVTIVVTNNTPPQVALPADFSEFQCTPTEICIDYTVTDPDIHAVTETMVSGYGTIDTAANQVCFTPAAAGTYEFIIRAADACGAFDHDTIVVTVEFGESALIDCPTGPIDVSLCAAEEVCYMMDIAPAGAIVTTSFGYWSSGQLCFTADTSGVYNITVIAQADCGTDTCVVTFNVDIGSAAEIVCPEPQTRFLCDPDTVCVPITVLMKGDTVTVSPIGTYSAGNVCFPADTAGHYELTVIASTSCGADTCTVVVDVTLNSPPIADDPPAVDTFLCDAAEICYQLTATDADNDSLTWSRLGGAGTVTPSGTWCFTPGADGVYSAAVVVTDPCGAADTVVLDYTIAINGAPVVDLGGGKINKVSIFECQSTELCIDYTVTDADNNVVTEELVLGTGTLDTLGNQVCFVPDTSGVYEFIVRATDACGETDEDTVEVTVTLNVPPTVDAGPDQSVFVCGPEAVCWSATVEDADDNIDSVYITGPVGVFAAGEICFTPDTAGLYVFILRVVDECGIAAEDTVTVTAAINTAPVCDMPGDTTLFQCTPQAISLPVGAVDEDGNLDHCEIITGPGSLSGGLWTYTPSTDQTVKVRVMCIDSCGAMCEDSFTVAFDINGAPVVDLGPDGNRFLCEPGPVCVPLTVTDEDDNLSSTEVISPAGAVISGDELCADATSEGLYTFIVEAVDDCGLVRRDTARVTVAFNSPPTLTTPPSFSIYLDVAGEVCFDVTATDPDDNLTSITAVPLGTHDGSYSNGEVCFTAGESGEYCFEITARDGCQEEVVDTVCVDVQVDECIHVAIEKTHGTYQGQHEFVDIFQQSSGKPVGGFNLLVEYDASALLVNSVLPGDLLESCGWEYFTYRQGADGNCSGCPSGLLRIVGIAETNNGANHPGCFLDGQIGSLATIDFFVTNNRSLECMYVPVRFFWIECGDNAFSDQSGDTLWISRRVFDLEMVEITNNSYGMPGYFGAPDACLIGGGPGKPAAIRCVDFTNGGIDIVCADSIDARGDLNLNGIAYEIADAVLFTNILIYGINILPLPEPVIAASDVNADGIPLTVGDLVYLIRVVVGDALPYPKLDPNLSAEVQFAFDNHVLAIEKSDYRVGALFVTLEGTVAPRLHADASGMEMRYESYGDETRVLIYNMSGNAWLESGDVLDLEGISTRIKSIDVGSYDGAVLQAKINSLPEQFELLQNYPNPFNPTTTIEFALPVKTDWSLTVYNVLGRTVETFSGRDDMGYMKLEWDAGKYASGVYLYRLKAGEYSATRKMVLLK